MAVHRQLLSQTSHARPATGQASTGAVGDPVKAVTSRFVACSGFAVSLLVAIRQIDPQFLSTEAVVMKFKMEDGDGRIYGGRVPHLAKRGVHRS